MVVLFPVRYHLGLMWIHDLSILVSSVYPLVISYIAIVSMAMFDDVSFPMRTGFVSMFFCKRLPEGTA